MTKGKAKRRIVEIDPRQIPIDPMAEQLMKQPQAQPYIAYATAVIKGEDTGPALEQIRALPFDKRYTFRIIQALEWGFADFDSESIKADREAITREEWEKLLEAPFGVRAAQFCLFVATLLGASRMERTMLGAIEQAKDIAEEG